MVAPRVKARASRCAARWWLAVSVDRLGPGGVPACAGGRSPFTTTLQRVMVAFGADSSSSGPTLSTRKLQGKLDKLDPTKRLTILDWLVTFRAACGADFSEFFSEVQLEIPKTKEEFLSRFISDPKYIADDKWDALTWSPRPLPGLLHAWDTQDCSLHFSV